MRRGIKGLLRTYLRRMGLEAFVKFQFYQGKKKLSTEVNEMKGLWKGIGLMWRSKNTSNLLFTFDRPSRVALTSLFVFFPYVAVWLDSKKRIIESRVSRPFELSFQPKRNASYLIELPLNARNEDLLSKIGVTLA